MANILRKQGRIIGSFGGSGGGGFTDEDREKLDGIFHYLNLDETYAVVHQRNVGGGGTTANLNFANIPIDDIYILSSSNYCYLNMPVFFDGAVSRVTTSAYHSVSVSGNTFTMTSSGGFKCSEDVYIVYRTSQ